MLVIIAALFFAMPPSMYPPARFDHPFKGQVVTHWLSDADTRICRSGTACTFPQLGKCGTLNAGKFRCVIGGPGSGGTRTIWINEKVRGSNIEDLVIRHETAHCNGWPANHPP